MISALITALLAANASAPEPPRGCTLNELDRRANAALSFYDFDQNGTLPGTARKLGEAGCWREAAEATADYLVHGPVPTPGQQRILLFHLGQALALGGEDRRAADFIAATRSPAEEMSRAADALRWNDYVVGTWAFLVKDRPALVAARDAVLAGGGVGNRINGAILAAMVRCFDKPYRVAYNPKCGLTP